MSHLDDFLQRLKMAVSLSSIVEKSGVQLRKEGHRLKGLCPFHGEKTPSFIVFPDEERFHCFGCGQHGDVVDYVQHRNGLDFWGAVTELAREAGLPLPERDPEDAAEAELRRSISETLETFVQASHQALLADASALAYLHQRGFTQETILDRQIGLATYKGAIQSGNTEGAVAAGLLDRHFRAPTVAGRLVFPIRKGGKVVNLSCRTLQPDEKPKYKILSGLPPVPADSNLLRSAGRVALCEGLVDAWLGQQSGIKMVATIGTYFKPEWIPLCSKSAEYVCCYDNDANQAGQKANVRVADALFEAGLRVAIADLPDGMDPADVIQHPDYGAAALQRYINAALPYVDWLIQRLPAPRNPQEVSDRLETVLFPKLLRMPPVSVDGYLDQIVKVLGVRKVALRQHWEQFSKTKKAEPNAEKKTGDEEATVIWEDDNPVMFNPAQSFVKGLGIFTVYVKTDQGLRAKLVTSDRRLLDLSPAVAGELGLVFRDNKYPSEQIRWPIGKRYANSVKAWLDGAEKVDAAALFHDVRALISRHIHWPVEYSAVIDFITLWTIGTYVHQLFESYPYVHVRALPDSGKSTLLNVIMHVAFNGTPSTATTESVVSRSANSDSATMGIDEAENYRAKTQDETSAIFEVLKGGYKKGAISRKAGTKKDNFRPESFDTYCPKIFASTQPIDPILATRCIDVPLLRTGQSMPPFLPEEIDLQLQEMRGHLYCWALSQWENIRDAYLAIKPRDAWLNRSFELWKPMLALAEYFSACTGEDISGRLESLATELRRQKAEREREQNASQRIVSVIMDFIRAHQTPEEFYPVPMIVDAIKQEMGWEKYSPEMFSRFVFDEAHFATDRKHDKRKLTHGMFSRQVPHIRLNKRRVWEQAVTLFGFDREILAEVDGDPKTGAGIAGIPPDPFDE